MDEDVDYMLLPGRLCVAPGQPSVVSLTPETASESLLIYALCAPRSAMD